VRKVLFFGLLVLTFAFWARTIFTQQACIENTGLFSEHFRDLTNIDAAHSSAKFWCQDQTSPRDIMTMNKLGANFQISNPAYMPSWVTSVAAGDFDLDGWPDFIGSSDLYCNVLAFVRNMGGQGQVGTFKITQWIDGCSGDSNGFPLRGVGGASIDTSGHCGLTAGDYDGDGDIDFLFIASSKSSPYAPKRIWLYRNNLISSGVNTGVLSFTKIDLTAAWSAAVEGITWTSTFMTSVDFDRDGDIDIILGNSAGEVLKITNTNNRAINAQTFIVETTPLISTGWGGSGINTVSVADFDNDGDMDIIVGSVSTSSLRYYKNDGQGHLTLYATYSDSSGNLSNDLFDGAATVSLAVDFEGDGDVDLVIGTDNWNYPNRWPNYGDTGYGGKAYYFKNNGDGTFTQKLIFNGPGQPNSVNDLDCGLIFDYDKDGRIDFMIANGNQSLNYYLFHNTVADVYNITGQGISLNLTPTLSSQYAITRVRMPVLNQSILGSSSTGLSVTYYVSNNDGQNWESYGQYAGSAIRNVTNQPWHDFHSFGSKLCWKAVFSAPNDTIPGFDSASYETPSVDQIQLEYVYVEKREYSRTSDAATTITVNGQTEKILVAATFIFPGLEGQLRAYDVTNLAALNTSYSSLQMVSSADTMSPLGRYLTPGVQILWDAGQLLQDRSPDNRNIYAAYKQYSGNPLTRMNFTRANASTLASLLGDPDGDNAGLIDFIRGTGQSWKLADIQHSNPVIVGPPSGDPALMGSGYASFAQAWVNRPKVVFVGANDGMLHCFNVTTGEELWGFIPYNLLPKLKNLSQKDPLTGVRYRASDEYVDGSPSVADVYINSAWKTVLICGQGPGSGSSVGGGLNYYFALDVTDPQNPQPLWEFTGDTVGETWSVPAIGRVMQGSTPRWVAFMGSGYDNDPSHTAGNVFYVVRIDTGQTIFTKTVSNVNTNAYGFFWPYTDIYVALPGSPTALDSDGDGNIECVYIGDLDGRLWKLDTTNSNTYYWSFTAVYTDRLNYPIISKPAVWVDPLVTGSPAHIYFGTGGDDRAPSDRNYAFLAVLDGSTPTVEWYLGNPNDLGIPLSKATGTLGAGEKAWADPVVSDNTVYFSTLKGSIENVNPCLNLSDVGRLYARYIQTEAGGVLGGTALKGAQGSTTESLQLTSKTRRAVTLGELQKVGTETKREVYIQEYDSGIERLEQPGGKFLLKIKSWREVYKIIK
jgi:hypothetical protein